MIDASDARTGVRDSLSALFPQDVITLVALPEMADGTLLDGEMIGTERMVPKRRREYTAGRVAARAALARLGITGHPLTVGEAREPQWPAGVVGSLSHCDGLCVVAVTPAGRVRSLGVDVEPATPLPPGALPIVCTAGEQEGLAGASDRLLGKILFSAKESIYKAWYPVVREPLEFQEASVSINAEAGTWSATISRRAPHTFPATVRGRFRITGGFVLTGVVVPSTGMPATGGPV